MLKNYFETLKLETKNYPDTWWPQTHRIWTPREEQKYTCFVGSVVAFLNQKLQHKTFPNIGYIRQIFGGFRSPQTQSPNFYW